MSMLRPDTTQDDLLAHRAAIEAVLGVTAKREPLSQESIRAWLGVALNEDIALISRAMHFAVRIMDGPIPHED